jgi:putative membrane protein
MAKPALLLSALMLMTSTGHSFSAQETPMPMPTKDFVAAAAQSDQFEIQEARVAAAQSKNAQVRAFAQQMIQDHTRAKEALEQAAMKSGISPPPKGIDPDQAKLLSALQSLSGSDFDKTYAKQQVLAHQQALAVQQNYASAGSDPNVREAASSAVPLIQRHLEMAQQMRSMVGTS